MNFDEFIRQETQNTEDLSQQKKKMLNEWLAHIGEFYDKVKSFLKEYIDAETVRINEEDIEIVEEFLGSYKAKKMIIHLGNNGKHVDLVPIAADVIGAYGRIDMKGIYGIIRIVLVNAKLNAPKINVTIRLADEYKTQEHSYSEPELEWKFATTPPNIKYVRIDKETFLEQLMFLTKM